METAWNLGDGVVSAADAAQKALDLAFHSKCDTKVVRHEVDGLVCTLVVTTDGKSPVVRAMNRGEALRAQDCAAPCSCGPHVPGQEAESTESVVTPGEQVVAVIPEQAVTVAQEQDSSPSPASDPQPAPVRARPTPPPPHIFPQKRAT